MVLSLIFVGVEIRDGNREARAATTQAYLDAEMVFQAALIDHSGAWQQVIVSGDMSDPVATQQATALFNMAMTLENNRFSAARAGYLEYSDGTLKRAVAFPFYDIWRGSVGAAGRSPEFLELTDRLRQGETTE